MEQSPANNLAGWIHTNALRLLLAALLSGSILIAYHWLQGSVTYADWRATFYSPSLNSLWEFAYYKSKFYVAAPEQGKSWVFSGPQITALKRKYWLAAVASFYTLLGCLALALFFKLLKSYRQIWRFLLDLTEYRKFIRITRRSFLLTTIFLLCLLSLFPIERFASWWKDFAFMKPLPPAGSFLQCIYDFSSAFVVYKTQKLFYALLFTLPVFFLELIAAAALTLLTLRYFPVPKRIKNIVRPLPESADLYLMAAAALLAAAASFIQASPQQMGPERAALLFQGKIFASGALSWPIKYSKEFFTFPFMSDESAWYSQLPPGYALLLALSFLLRAPRLSGPVLAAAAVIVTCRLGRNLYGRAVALPAAVTLALAPLLMTNWGERHLATALFSALGLLYYQKSRQNQTGPPSKARLLSLAAGLCWGGAFLCGPLTALCFFLPCLLHNIKGIIKKEAHPLSPPLLLAAFLAGAAFLPFYNYRLSGRLFFFGYNELFMAKLHQALKPWLTGLFHLSFRMKDLNFKLLGPWVPALLFILPVPLWSRDKNRWDNLVWSVVLLNLAAHSLFFTDMPGIVNPLQALLPLLFILSARGILLFPVLCERLGLIKERAACPLALLLLFSLGTGVYNNHFHIKKPPLPDLKKETAQKGPGRALVFLPPRLFPRGFSLNSPALDDNIVVYARDLKGYNYKLMSEFPRREYYLYRPYAPSGENFLKIKARKGD